MLDVLVIAAGRSRTVDVLLVAGYALVLPAFIRAVRSRRRRRPSTALAGHPANVVTLPERPPTAPQPPSEPVVAEREPLQPEPAPPQPAIVTPATVLPPAPPAPLREAEPTNAYELEAVEYEPDDEEEILAADVDECEIVVWHGFRKSHFYAAPVLDDGVAALGLYASPLFRARNGAPDRTDEAVAAHNALVAMLERDDWVLVDKGEAWYSGRFRRSEAAPA